jgi:hypothetical protein
MIARNLGRRALARGLVGRLKPVFCYAMPHVAKNVTDEVSRVNTGSIVSTCLLVLAATLCCAQTHPVPVKRVDPLARRDQLAEVSQKLADPDPDARTSYMESVVSSGDTTLIQKAISVALRSDDASLHNLALRAYMASIHEIIFTVNLPDKLKAKIDDAELDPDAKKALQQSMPWLAEVQSLGGSVHLGIFKYAFSGNTGGWSWNNNRNDWGKWAPADAGFTISGDHLTSAIVWGRHNCNIAVRASSDLTLRGTMMCAGGSLPTLPISVPMQ